MARLLHYSDVENVYDDPAAAGRLATCLRTLAGRDGDALVVGTGDNTAPGVVALAERGLQAVDLFDAVDTAFETFGNHDFDFGPDATRDVVSASSVTWVSTNTFLDGERFGAEEGVVPHAVTDVGDQRVGFVGVTDPATGSLNPMAGEVTFTDPLDAVRAARDELGDVDRVVVLSHLGAGDDELAAIDGVDVVLGGHVHSLRNELVGGTRCTRPGVNGQAVVEVDLSDGTATVHETAGYDPYEPLVERLRERVTRAGFDEVVGHVDDPMSRDHDVVFGGECRVGNFVADAYRWATDADVGLQNSGGLREGPALSGAVTTGDLVSLVPFEEQVVRAEVTGNELRQILAESAGSAVGFGEPHWWHGHVSGVTLELADGTLTDVRVDGDPLDDEATYTIGTSDYLLHTDHEFPTLEQRHRGGEVGIQYEVLWAYARERGVVGTTDGRIRR